MKPSGLDSGLALQAGPPEIGSTEWWEFEEQRAALELELNLRMLDRWNGTMLSLSQLPNHELLGHVLTAIRDQAETCAERLAAVMDLERCRGRQLAEEWKEMQEKRAERLAQKENR